MPPKRIEFAEHKLEHIIQLKHQNVYKDGFELVDEVDSGLALACSYCETRFAEV